MQVYIHTSLQCQATEVSQLPESGAGERRLVAMHTCTATLTCKSIEIYIGMINKIKQLFDRWITVHYLSYHASIYPYKSPMSGR